MSDEQPSEPGHSAENARAETTLPRDIVNQEPSDYQRQETAHKGARTLHRLGDFFKKPKTWMEIAALVVLIYYACQTRRQVEEMIAANRINGVLATAAQDANRQAREAAKGSDAATKAILTEFARAAAAAEKAAGATETSASAARRSASTAEAALLSQRAVLDLTGIAPKTMDFPLPMTGAVEFTNTGHSQAINMTGFVTWQWEEARVLYPAACVTPRATINVFNDFESHDDVAAGKSFTMPGKIPDTEPVRIMLREVQEGRRRAFLCGELKYADIFGRNWKRLFCQTFDRPTGAWVSCLTGNRETREQ